MTTAIEAFKAYFKTDKVPDEQSGMALRFGGNHDIKTIESIPVQAERLWVYLFRLFGRPPTRKEIMDDIDLRRWDLAENGKWQRIPAWDKSGEAIANARDLLIQAHYLALFDRRPDDLGMAYWRDELDKMVVEVLREKLISGARGPDRDKVAHLL